MYEQLTIHGIDLQAAVEPQEAHINYAFPCGGCICDKCANNVECLRVDPGEQEKACFNCDYCLHYNGYGLQAKKMECREFKITNYAAKKNRYKIKIMR